MSKKDKNNKSLPVVVGKKDLVPIPQKEVGVADPFKAYLRDISQYELLTKEEEERLTEILEETGDIEIAKKLVVANLRLVVKIAMEYRKSYSNIMDLIQEGNIGLMKAVSKYDGSKGAKLSYYASWWIRSYILKFILDNFRLVKVGTTKEQKKLFYNLMREKQKLLSMGIEPDSKQISKNLGVSEKSVVEMDKRIGEFSGDMSLDLQYDQGGTGGKRSLGETLSYDQAAIDDKLASDQELEILRSQMANFIQILKKRDQDIFKKRLLAQAPMSLQAIADEYGVSRERIRQVEKRLIEKLRVYMKEYLR